MKFVHIADFHFDSAFANLSEKEGLGEKCRLKQMKVLKNIIEYIKENEIENLFISGDLYEQKYIKESTIKNINNLFSEIPQTKIYIAPGNHDPYIKNSYYNRFKWAENVKIFSGKIERVETEEADIYGFGFDDFYCNDSGLENFEIVNKDKINILIMHADLDATPNTQKPYNPISAKLIKSKGFNYVALGHIHKPAQIDNLIVYPGSAFPQGFDELGARGMVVGEITSDTVNTKLVPLNEITFEEVEIDVTELVTKEELLEKINLPEGGDTKSQTLMKITLTGKRNFEIDKYDLFKYIENDNVIRIKNCTEPNIDLEELSSNNTLKGIFATKMKEKLKNEHDEEQKQIIKNAIEVGLKVLK